MPTTFGDAPAEFQKGAPPVRRGHTQTDVLPHVSNSDFLLKHHPARWHWDPEGGAFFPLLGRTMLQEGLNGVDKEGDADLAVSNGKKFGWAHLEPELVGEYVHTFPTADGKRLHLTRWESPRAVGTRAAGSLLDADGYRRWLADLVDEGIIPAPRSVVLDVIIETYEETVSKMAKRGLQNLDPDVFERAKATLEAMRSRRVCTNVEPAPKAKRSKAKPADAEEVPDA